MSSFGGVDFHVQSVNSHQWPGAPRVQDQPRMWAATVQIDSAADLADLDDWFCTIDARRGLRNKTWVLTIKSGPGSSTLRVSFGFDQTKAYTGAVLTRIHPRADAWRNGRYLVDVEFTLP